MEEHHLLNHRGLPFDTPWGAVAGQRSTTSPSLKIKRIFAARSTLAIFAARSALAIFAARRSLAIFDLEDHKVPRQ
jgi:hypothetical protein